MINYLIYFQFYADDRRDKANVITTHTFHTVVSARFIRILASTDVRWIGEAEKCFRFEILGCHPELITPEINFEAVSKPAGYLEAMWSQPQLIIARNEAVTLKSQQYLVNVSHIEDDLILQEFNVSDNALIVPKPLWDTTYTFNLECTHENFLENNLNCGRFEVKAIIHDAPKDCLKNLHTCPIEDRVHFVMPETIEAVSRMDRSVIVSWKDSNMGWRTSKRRVKVLDENDKTLLTVLSQENEHELKISDLTTVDKSYKLVFAPEGPIIPNFVQEFTTTLSLRKYQIM